MQAKLFVVYNLLQWLDIEIIVGLNKAGLETASSWKSLKMISDGWRNLFLGMPQDFSLQLYWKINSSNGNFQKLWPYFKTGYFAEYLLMEQVCKDMPRCLLQSIASKRRNGLKVLLV